MTRMGTYWNPWREMNRLRQEMDHLVHHEWAPLSRGTVGFPPVNLWENEKGLRVTAEIPGLDAAQLDVSLEKDVLTISGARAEVGSSNAEEDYVLVNGGLSRSSGPLSFPSKSIRINATRPMKRAS